MRRRVLASSIAAAGLLASLATIGVWGRDHRAADHEPQARVSGPETGQALLHAADPSRGAGLFGQCAACHPIGRGSDDRDGPNLYGVVGAPVAERRPLFAYTASLRRLGGTWTHDRLDAWLTDPAALVPGTAMRFPGLPDSRDRADLIAFLASQGPTAAHP